MKRRGKAIALSTVAVGVVVLVCAGIASKDWVIGEWQFWKVSAERGEKTAHTVMPRDREFKNVPVDVAAGDIEAIEFVRFVADYTAIPVVMYSKDLGGFNQSITVLSPMTGCTAETAIRILKANNFFVSRERLLKGETCWVVERAMELEGPSPPLEEGSAFGCRKHRYIGESCRPPARGTEEDPREAR